MIYWLRMKIEHCKFLRLWRAVVCRCVVVLLLCVAMPAGAQNYFRTEAGVPYIPALNNAPASPSTGAIYLDPIDGLIYRYRVNKWLPMAVSLTADGTAINPMTTASGRIWMDRNLGATQIANGVNDANAFGSYYQWCRAADGHQLPNSPVYNGQATTAANSTSNSWYGKFIIPNDFWLNYMFTDGSLWWNGTTAGANNPCPAGYHVPTKNEWQAEINAGLSLATMYNYMKLTLNGFRNASNGVVSVSGTLGMYSTSSANDIYCSILYINASAVQFTTGLPSYGQAVRCIKN